MIDLEGRRIRYCGPPKTATHSCYKVLRSMGGRPVKPYHGCEPREGFLMVMTARHPTHRLASWWWGATLGKGSFRDWFRGERGPGGGMRKMDRITQAEFARRCKAVRIMRYEEIDADFQRIFGKPLCARLHDLDRPPTVAMLDGDDEDLIMSVYGEDYDAFGYEPLMLAHA